MLHLYSYCLINSNRSNASWTATRKALPPVCAATLSPLPTLHAWMHAMLSLTNQDLWKYSLPAPLNAVHRAHCYSSNVSHVSIYADICMYYVYEFFTALASDFLQVLRCRKRLKPHHHYHHPPSTTILQSLRVQAPKSIERKKSALWSSPYICQGGEAGGAALLGRTGEQYHSICHKPFHL